MEEKYYEVASSEKTAKSSADHETRTLLFLMGYLTDSDKIDSFIIDVLNDVTATNKDDTIVWDAQSKGDSLSSPKEIGRDLVTLFRNYLSIIDFNYYILSIKAVSKKHLLLAPLIDCNQPIMILCYSDFTNEAQNDIKLGLLEACDAKTYITDYYSFNSVEIDSFLKKVIIVLNNDEPQNYIKKIAFTKDEMLNDKVLNGIFNEIKAKQLSIKSSSNVNGIKLKSINEAHNLGRDLSFTTINSLILSRIINNDFIDKNNGGQYIPVYFNDYLSSLNLPDEDSKIDFLQDCINEIYKILSFKNMNKEFWDLLYDIVSICKNNKTDKIEDIYFKLDKTNIYFYSIDKNSMLYFIACIKGGLKNED